MTPLKAKEDLAKHPSSSIYIKNIIITPENCLSQRKKNKLIVPYVGQKLSSTTLEQLVNDVRAHYIMQGYPTVSVRALLGDEIRSGIIKLEIIHGHIKKITLGKNNFRERMQIYTAFPFMQGKLLYLPTLEQRVDQMNSVFSNNATLKIFPSKSVGASIIRIENTVKYPWRLELGRDEQNKSIQYKSNLGLDNLLAINDSWSIQYTSNRPFKKISVKENPDSKKASRTSRLDTTFSSILGSYSFAGSYKTSSDTNLAVQKMIKSLHVGSSKTFMLEVKKTLFHYRQRKLILALSGEKKNKDASSEIFKLNGSSIPGSKYPTYEQMLKTYVANGSLSYTAPVGTGNWSSAVTYNWGRPWKADRATSKPNHVSYLKDNDFHKIGLEMNWGQLYRLPRNFLLSYQFKLSAQHGYTLPLGEHFSVSGMGGVRGLFEDVQAPSGITMRHEFTLPQLLSFHRATLPLQLFVGLDWGRKLFENNDEKNWFGWACGFRYNAYGLNINAVCAVPITAPDIANNHKKIVQGHKLYLFFTLSCHELIAAFF